MDTQVLVVKRKLVQFEHYVEGTTDEHAAVEAPFASVTILVSTEPPSAMLWIRSMLRYQRAYLKGGLSSSLSARGNVFFLASTSSAGILSKMNTRAEKVCASWSME